MESVRYNDFVDWRERIEENPAVLAGKPVIKGTRIAVEFVLDLFANGWQESQVLEEYPGLKHEDIRACFLFAKEATQHERIFRRPDAT